MDQFSAGALDVLVGNVAVVKVGVNLSAASTLVFAENSYSGEARIQAEERCTIRGKDAVEIVDFISTSDGNDLLGYIDDYILEAVRDKRDFSAQALRRSTCGTRTA
jgi:SNF2 family DNA or RNA helicase